MRWVDVVGAFFSGIVIIAALDVIVRPGGQTAAILSSFGDAGSSLVRAAKGS